MATKPLSTDLLKEALALVAKHGNVVAAARATGIPDGTLRHRYWRAQTHKWTDDAAPATPTPATPLFEPISTYEEAWRVWCRTIGQAKDHYAGPAPVEAERERQRIVVVPDLHAPFHEPDLFASLLAREKADRCICIGDLSDSYALSTFTHYKRVSFSEEWAQVSLCMQALSEHYPRVDIIIGNHDARLEKRLRERLTEDQVEAVKFIANGNLCPITALSKQFPNVHVSRHAVPGGESVDWFMTVGDAWLGHPEKFSRIPGAALRAVEEWLADNEEALGLEPYRLIVMGHTHAMSWIPWRANKLLVECGCLCQTQGYMLKPKIGGRPQRRGYVTFEQVSGKTDLNSVTMHWFDV